MWSVHARATRISVTASRWTSQELYVSHPSVTRAMSLSSDPRHIMYGHRFQSLCRHDGPRRNGWSCDLPMDRVSDAVCLRCPTAEGEGYRTPEDTCWRLSSEGEEERDGQRLCSAGFFLGLQSSKKMTISKGSRMRSSV